MNEQEHVLDSLVEIYTLDDLLTFYLTLQHIYPSKSKLWQGGLSSRFTAVSITVRYNMLW